MMLGKLLTNLISTYGHVDHAFLFFFHSNTNQWFKTEELLSLAGARHNLCCSEAYADHALSENFRQLGTGTGA